MRRHHANHRHHGEPAGRRHRRRPKLLHGLLGLTVEEFNLGWVARYRSPDGRVFVQLVTRDASAPENATISVHAGAGVDDAYAEARRRGYEIVHTLTDEPWGLRRFFVRAPDGTAINVTSHSEEG